MSFSDSLNISRHIVKPQSHIITYNNIYQHIITYSNLVTVENTYHSRRKKKRSTSLADVLGEDMEDEGRAGQQSPHGVFLSAPQEPIPWLGTTGAEPQGGAPQKI